eukprot:495360_1
MSAWARFKPQPIGVTGATDQRASSPNITRDPSKWTYMDMCDYLTDNGLVRVIDAFSFVGMFPSGAELLAMLDDDFKVVQNEISSEIKVQLREKVKLLRDTSVAFNKETKNITHSCPTGVPIVSDDVDECSRLLEFQCNIEDLFSDLKYDFNRELEECENQRNLIDKDEQNIQKSIFIPDSKGRIIWDGIFLCIMLYYVIITPINIAFKDVAFYIWFDVCLCAVLWLDMCIQARTAFAISKGQIREGQLEIQPKLVMAHYVITRLLMDIITNIPYDLIFYLMGYHCCSPNEEDIYGMWQVGRAIKLIRLVHVPYRLLMIRSTFKNTPPSIILFMKLMIILIFVVHWSSCSFWICLRATDPFFKTEFAPLALQSHTASDFTFHQQYISCIFVSICLMSGAGIDTMTVHSTQTLFIVLAMLLTVLPYLGIIEFAIISTQDMVKEKTQKKRKISSLLTYLRERDCTKETLQDIQSYLEFRWSRSLSEEHGVRNLDPVLRMKTNFQMYERFINNYKPFRQQSRECRQSLMEALSQRFCIKDQIITCFGMMAHSIYFIACGTCKEYDRYGNIVNNLYNGDSFGASECIRNTCHKTTVMAASYMEVYILKISRLQILFEKYPSLQEAIDVASGGSGVSTPGTPPNVFSPRATNVRQRRVDSFAQRVRSLGNSPVVGRSRVSSMASRRSLAQSRSMSRKGRSRSISRKGRSRSISRKGVNRRSLSSTHGQHSPHGQPKRSLSHHASYINRKLQSLRINRQLDKRGSAGRSDLRDIESGPDVIIDVKSTPKKRHPSGVVMGRISSGLNRLKRTVSGKHVEREQDIDVEENRSKKFGRKKVLKQKKPSSRHYRNKVAPMEMK